MGDPINRSDRRGTCSAADAGITQGPGDMSGSDGGGQGPGTTQDPSSFYLASEGLGAVSGYPYAGETLDKSLLNVLAQAAGVATNATAVAALAANFAIQQSPTGQITLYLFSGGAQAANTAWQEGLLSASNIQYVVYVEPGLPNLGGATPGVESAQGVLSGTEGTFFVNNLSDPTNILATGANSSFLYSTQGPPIQQLTTTCGHDFTCVMSDPVTGADGQFFNLQDVSAGPCPFPGWVDGTDGSGGPCEDCPSATDGEYDDE